jgi:hypothetical protein
VAQNNCVCLRCNVLILNKLRKGLAVIWEVISVVGS